MMYLVITILHNAFFTLKEQTHTLTQKCARGPFLISSFPQESRFQLELFVQW